jgi:hypothetical protein
VLIDLSRQGALVGNVRGRLTVSSGTGNNEHHVCTPGSVKCNVLTLIPTGLARIGGLFACLAHIHIPSKPRC